ncbi:hypothetical protein M427DRAFT_47635 [Gonapodya prolifera JEL478]|uniref:Uncharacterized protein n=1 Tax=Gonapodya prolifera (strain JEL478) TaxID=1344416 RepID=A0A139A2H4_GONPJ|nr:hypothetical protein M427DRAFT_47635 [Gonapodya prolifera JEL478]|eukprot:KXS10986.1 hypothetical protein M427DRAFT_47635 [Gonapodya prolifera JEL478]
MQPGWFFQDGTRKEQPMGELEGDGTFKLHGMNQILQERGEIDKEGMALNKPDFKDQKMILEDAVAKLGHMVIFGVHCHPKLQGIIEMSWGEAKGYVRPQVDGLMWTLERLVNESTSNTVRAPGSFTAVRWWELRPTD